MNWRLMERPTGWESAAVAQPSPFSGEAADRHPEEPLILRRLERKGEVGVGVWNVNTGHLVHFMAKTDHARWLPTGHQLLGVNAALRLSIVDLRDKNTVATTKIPFDQSHGVGGVELVVSPSGGLGCLWLWSGQSEEGFVLFEIPTLRTLATLEYVVGESATPPRFSLDEASLAMLVEPTAIWWAPDDDEADCDAPARGGRVKWLTLYLQQTCANGARVQHPVFIDLAPGWLPPEEFVASSWPRNLRFPSRDILEFDLPWGGTRSVDLRAREHVVLP